MSLLNNIKTGAGNILDILEKLNGAFMPSANPIADPTLEDAAGSEAAQLARAQYQRDYQAQRAAAIRDGARWYEVDALAAPGAQDRYTQNLARSAQAVNMLRDQRTKTGRLDALQKMIQGIADPQARAMAASNPEAYAEAAIKKQFSPETENFSMTALGDGSFAVLDKRNGDHKIIKDPEISAALKSGVASVQEAGGSLFVIGKDGRILQQVAVGKDPKLAAQEEKDHKRNETNMRRDFDKLDAVKNYRAVLPIINSAMKAPDTGAGDLDLIYAVGKILDPGSVVREGEMTLVIKSGSLMEQIMGAKRFQLNGKGRIDPNRRATLINMLQGRVDALRAPYEQARGTYSGYATEDGFEPSRIVGEDPLEAFRTQETGKVVKYTRDASGKLVRAQ